ncbi:MAG: methionine adenosyltransferase domain-containing protein, partial [Ignavibacteria bacterium]
VAEPVSYRIYDPTTSTEYGLGNFTLEDLTPQAIIDNLHLQAPIYAATARNGHFGVASDEINGIKHYAWEGA